MQSLWLQPDGSTCQAYVVIAVATLVMTAGFAMVGENIVLIVETLALGLMIASLIKEIIWRDEKLLRVRNVLLGVAFRECRCNPNAVIIEAPMEPELVGKPAGKGYCDVCEARAVLKEQFPGAIQYRVREHVLGGSPVPEVLLSYLTPSERVLLQDELAAGWKCPAPELYDWTGKRR